MKQFFKNLFDDSNTINEKSVVGFTAFIMMVVTLIADIATGVMGKTMPIHEFVFDGFMVIVLGAFGIASVDKFINKRKGEKE
jgi:ABC-type uncharacterized transport system permease subunit